MFTMATRKCVILTLDSKVKAKILVASSCIRAIPAETAGNGKDNV